MFVGKSYQSLGEPDALDDDGEIGLVDHFVGGGGRLEEVFENWSGY